MKHLATAALLMIAASAAATTETLALRLQTRQQQFAHANEQLDYWQKTAFTLNGSILELKEQLADESTSATLKAEPK